MLVVCVIHGNSSGVWVSPDLKEKLNAEEQIDTIVTVQFEDKEKGRIDFRCFLSPEYASKLGFDSNTTLPLERDHPKWFAELRPHCLECYRNCLSDSLKSGITVEPIARFT